MNLTRRHIILTGLGAIPAFATKDFWNQKQPSEWSEKEVQVIMTKSPWARMVTAEMKGRFDAGGAGGGRRGGGGGGGYGGGGGAGGPGGGGGMGGPGGGGGGYGGGGGGGSRGGGDSGMPTGGGMPEIHALVRWESALPIRTASKRDLPASLASGYLISVSGLPAWGGSGAQQQGPNPEQMEARLKSVTQLERKNRDPLAPARVQRSTQEGASIVGFFFDPGSQPIDLDDKEVVFVTRMGPLEIRAKFPLKEMVFDGKLAL